MTIQKNPPEEGWDDSYGGEDMHTSDDIQGGVPSVSLEREPGEEWFCRWDPLDNGRAGPTRTKIFWLCALPGLLQFLCGSLFLPALPAIDSEYNPTPLQATLTLSIYSFLSGIVPILWGPISDKYSRKWLLVVVRGSVWSFQTFSAHEGGLIEPSLVCHSELRQLMEPNDLGNHHPSLSDCHPARCFLCCCDWHPLRHLPGEGTRLLVGTYQLQMRQTPLTCSRLKGVRNLPGFMSVLLGKGIIHSPWLSTDVKECSTSNWRDLSVLLRLEKHLLAASLLGSV